MNALAGRIAVATAALAAGSTILLTTACATGQAGARNQPTASAAPAISSPPSPSSSPSAAVPVVGSVAGLPGWLYYEDANARVLRLTRSGVDTVMSQDGWSGNVSPDGASIAYIDQNNNVVVADRDGQHLRTVMSGICPPMCSSTSWARYAPRWPFMSRPLPSSKALREWRRGVVEHRDREVAGQGLCVARAGAVRDGRREVRGDGGAAALVASQAVVRRSRPAEPHLPRAEVAARLGVSTGRLREVLAAPA